MLRRVFIGALVKGTDWRINLIYMLVGESPCMDREKHTLGVIQPLQII